MTTGDTALARAAGDGDQEAFSALLARHYDALFRLCFRLTGRREAAEDLCQEICMALPAKLRAFRGDAAFTTWLYRIAVNAAHDQRRRAAAYGRATLGWGDWERARRASEVERAEWLDWLSQAMATLPEDLRDTLALTLGDELTQAQAAEVLGLSEGTVAWRLSEVRKRLKALKEREEQ
jgi:RNA polymerase sigma-70 factor (ECF subfamily)